MSKLRLAALLVPLLVVAVGGAVRAEEAGSGHYLPGMTSSFVDALPGKPGLAIASLFVDYQASSAATLPFPGITAAAVDADIDAETIAVVYQTERQILGGSYALGAALPFVTMDVRGTVTLPVLGAYSRTDHETGLGDMIFYPFLLGWKAGGGDVKLDLRLGIYAPTGQFREGRLANLGKNFWTFEPSASVSWLSSKLGTEASAYVGFDINTENDATDYESGSSFHVDGTIAQHLPLWGGFVGAGANYFAYVQITGDGGSGAVLGDFKGHSIGVGPVLSYVHEVAGHTLAVELKWLPELEVEKRLDGEYIWAKLGLVF